MHGMQLYIYIQHKAKHILEDSSIWQDFVNCLDCISNSKYEYERLSPSVFCIINLNYFRCLLENRMEQPCLETCIAYRDKQKGQVLPVTHSEYLGQISVLPKPWRIYPNGATGIQTYNVQHYSRSKIAVIKCTKLILGISLKFSSLIVKIVANRVFGIFAVKPL